MEDSIWSIYNLSFSGLPIRSLRLGPSLTHKKITFSIIWQILNRKTQLLERDLQT